MEGDPGAEGSGSPQPASHCPFHVGLLTAKSLMWPAFSCARTSVTDLYGQLAGIWKERWIVAEPPTCPPVERCWTEGVTVESWVHFTCRARVCAAQGRAARTERQRAAAGAALTNRQENRGMIGSPSRASPKRQAQGRSLRVEECGPFRTSPSPSSLARIIHESNRP